MGALACRRGSAGSRASLSASSRAGIVSCSARKEDLELALLQFMIEFSEARSAKPGVVVYKGYSETKTGIVLETFPFSGTRSTPANASSFFRLDWADLRCLAKRPNVTVQTETPVSRP
jgi:hypothetical protein